MPLPNLKDKLTAAATGISDMANTVVGAARQTPEAVKGAFGTAADAVNGAANTITGTVKAGVQKVEDGVQAVADGIQSARTFTANTISTSGNVIGIGGVVVAEALLISGGVVPFLVLGAVPVMLGNEFIKSVDGLAKAIRGKRVQFIGVNHEGPDILLEAAALVFLGTDAGRGTVNALIYDPHHPHRNAAGIVEISEGELVRQLHIMSGTRAEREAAYRTALTAVQDAKFCFGIKRDTPLIVAETKFGNPTKEDAPALTQK